MNAEKLYSELVSKGVKITVDGEQLRIRAPKGAISPQLRDQLAADKQELLLYLRRQELLENSKNTPLRAVGREQHMPTSYAQQGLWLLDQVEGGGPRYNLLESFSLRGALDADSLAQAFRVLVSRHEVLRTGFVNNDGIPAQRIEPHVGFELRCVDFSDERDPRAALDEWALKEVETPFDLSTAPLMRATLSRMEPTWHILGITVHHIVCDAWSFKLMVDEIFTLYDALTSGREPPGPVPSLHYVDYAAWQRDTLSSEVLEGQRQYWRERLAGVPPALRLPIVQKYPHEPSFHGSVERFSISPEDTAKLRQLGTEVGSTLFMVLMSAIAAFLSRVSGQEDVLFGTPFSNRKHKKTETMLGFFVNTIMMRVDTSGDPTFTELVERMREITLEAYMNQDFPFEQLVQELRPDRIGTRSPLFQVIFVFLQDTADVDRTVNGVTVEHFQLERITAKFDLNITIETKDGGLRGRLEYPNDLFSAAEARQLVRQFTTLLDVVARCGDQTVSSIPLASAGEIPQLLEQSSGPQMDRLDVIERFEDWASRMPEMPAVRSAGVSMTYAQLSSQSNQVAHALGKRDVGVGTRVGVCADRLPDMAVGFLAALKAGASYVPLDPTLPAERLTFMVKDCGLTAIVSNDQCRALLPDGCAAVISLDGDREELAAEDATTPASGAGADSPAYVIYTSGSTGVPKGVELPHRVLQNLIAWQLADTRFTHNARVMQFAPISFDVSVQEMLTTWCSGGVLVSITAEEKRDPQNVIRLVEAESIQRMFVPVVALDQFVNTVRDTEPLQHLREFYVAGEQLRITPKMRTLFAKLPDCTLYNHYGPSETHVVTGYVMGKDPAKWPTLPPIGRPVANTRVAVMDTSLRPVPPGVVGEICVAGDALGDGYVNRPQEEQARFVCDPQGTRWYRTGDLGCYRADNDLLFLGRRDEQVKIRGFRVEPGEIEAVLAGHPDIGQSCIVARGSGATASLAAYYVNAEGSEVPSVPELKEYLRSHLPDYMIPTSFMPLEEMPVTASGKIDRRALPVPESIRESLETPFVAPRTERETELVKLWEKLLDADGIGIEDDFFELGGHSLLATQMANAVAETWKVEVPMPSFFREPTIESLAKLVEVLQMAASQSPVDIEADDADLEIGVL